MNREIILSERLLSHFNNNMLAVKKAGHLNIKIKVASKEYSLASQSERVPQSYFYVKVAHLSYGEYSTPTVVHTNYSAT